ncbi:hypothetical protein ACFYXC_33250 [Streptomyces sp. NPDC002701]|uniref:hypothetical protein n=1 Tax=Streptomyces sp. NPDC002701 TaxID=3364661 RepID=UPI0036D10BD1
MADQSNSAIAPRVPALRPRGARAPGIGIVRQARVYADRGNLVVRDGRRRERRYTVGGAGIRRAAFFPPADMWETAMKRANARWGIAVFEDAEGRHLLHVPLAEWLPEAGTVGTADVGPLDCLERTGLKDLCDSLGIPFSQSPTAWGREASENPGDGRPDTAHNALLPPWHSWVRGIGVFGWLIALGLFFILKGADVWGLMAAVALLLVPGSDAVMRVLDWWRTRDDARLSTAVTVRPSPAQGSGATRRFLETTAVRVLPDDVVLTNTIGEERWLARRGGHGVARLVRLMDPASSAPLGIEFRDGKGKTRALLPWRSWFAGPGGSENWSELVAALALPVSDENFKGSERAGHTERSGTTDPWWRSHVLAGDARKMSPMGGKEARRATSWQESVIGGNEVMLVPLFSLLLLPGVFSDTGSVFVAGILSALTIVLALTPSVVHRLSSSFKLDRPIEPESS